MIAIAAVLLIPLCDLREAVLNTDILLYVDDKVENMELSTWPQGKRVQGEILS